MNLTSIREWIKTTYTVHTVHGQMDEYKDECVKKSEWLDKFI